MVIILHLSLLTLIIQNQQFKKHYIWINVQVLPSDNHKSKTFYDLMLNINDKQRNFLSHILYKDEVTFTTHRTFNQRKNHRKIKKNRGNQF